jgi:hypothetical protein
MRHNSTKSKVEVKTIGASGQLSLGKKYAGRTVTVEALEDGVWVVRTAQVIPDHELWLHTPSGKRDLAKGLEWLEERSAMAADLDAMEKTLRARLKQPARKKARK